MSSTETTARSPLCFSGGAVCAAICAVLPGHPVVLGLLPHSRLTALPSSLEPRLALLRDAKGGFDMTLPWAGSPHFLVVSTPRSPWADGGDLVVVAQLSLP